MIKNKEDTSPRLPFSLRGYTFTEFIGEGGFSKVYKVLKENTNFEFVAKVVSSEKESDSDTIWESFDAELRALRNIDHPHVIRLYDFFRVNKNYVLILEYLPGGTLQDEIAKNPHGLPYQRLITVCQQLVMALSYCHSRNISHQDIKPQNVLIDKYGRIKLADFGLSIQSECGQKTNRFRGSFLYYSPEIFERIAHSPFKSDVWSLGVTFCYLAQGRSPFPTENATAMRQAVIAGQYTLRSDIPTEFRAAVARMIVVDPDDRIAAGELLTLPVFTKKRRMSLQNSSQILQLAAGTDVHERPVSLMIISSDEQKSKRRSLFRDGGRESNLRKSPIPTFTSYNLS